MIAIGVTGGLAYGWVINPVNYVDTAPQSLRADYKADYVLMVAKIYRSDQNLPAAKQRLAFLSSAPPQQITSESIIAAQGIGYADEDLEVMGQLMQAIQAASSAAGTETPAAGEQP
jgi:hypothetical protein